MERLPSDPNLIPKPEMVEPEQGAPEVSAMPDYDEGDEPHIPHSAQKPGDHEPNANQPNTQAEITGSEQPPKTDENDERWDHDKAEALASVLKNKEKEDDFEHETYMLKHRYNNEAVEREVQDRTRTEQSDVDSANEWGDPEVLKRAKDALENKQAKVKDEIEKQRKIDKYRATKIADNILSPFEELYDINPDKFKDLPTSEFIEITKGFKQSTESVYEWQAYHRDIQATCEAIDRSLETGKETYGLLEFTNELEDIAFAVFEERFGNDDEFKNALESFKKRLRPEPGEAFDMSPRDHFVRRRELAQQLEPQVAELLEAAQARKQAFIDKHKSTDA